MRLLKIDPQAVSLDYNGLQMKREFYSPVYATAAYRLRADCQISEMYCTGHRMCVLTTPAMLRSTFYASDVKANIVIIQGLDAADTGSQALLAVNQ